ncbi:hypothetical protein ABFA07_003686 [Porites harrisoni]
MKKYSKRNVITAKKFLLCFLDGAHYSCLGVRRYRAYVDGVVAFSRTCTDSRREVGHGINAPSGEKELGCRQKTWT